jgi:DNA helicase-2/ATP-dependent DNA helicase PcrA
MKYLEGLNEQQEAAVWHKDGPLLILAGAGSGKTRVITCRIAHLINYYQVKPWNILAITFTNKAAREMKERVSALLGEQMNGIWIYTFHAACIQILRQHIDKLGFDRQFLIFDSDDQLSSISVSSITASTKSDKSMTGFKLKSLYIKFVKASKL